MIDTSQLDPQLLETIQQALSQQPQGSPMGQPPAAAPTMAQPQGLGAMLSKIGLTKLGGGLGQFGNSFRNAIAPTDPSLGVDPAYAKSQQRLAGLRLAAGIASGHGLGQGLAQGLDASTNQYQSAMENAYHNALQKKQQESQQAFREHQLEQDKVAQQHWEASQQNERERIKLENERLKISQGQLDLAKNKSTINVTSGNLKDWTPEALDLASEQLYRTGKAPTNLGRGSPVLAELYRMAGDKAKTEGRDSTAAIFGQQAYHSAGIALNDLTKRQTVMGAAERTASANLDLALRESAKVDRSGSPLLNKAIVHFKQNITGDPETQGFVNALVTARNEYAKVISGATGAQGITDAARKEASELFDKVTSPEALKYAVGIAKEEMANRMRGFDEEQARLKDVMNPKTASPSPPPPTETAAERAKRMGL